MRFVLGAAGVAMLACAGCHSASQVVPEPNAITLEDAMVGTVKALNAAYQEARKPGNEVMGYYPCTVTANYNISATGTTTNKVGAGVSGGIQGISLSVNASNEDSLVGTRGNSVQLVLASSLCLPGNAADTASGAKPPARGGARTNVASTGGGAAAGGGAGAATAGGGGPAVGALPRPKQVFSLPLKIEGLKTPAE